MSLQFLNKNDTKRIVLGLRKLLDFSIALYPTSYQKSGIKAPNTKIQRYCQRIE